MTDREADRLLAIYACGDLLLDDSLVLVQDEPHRIYTRDELAADSLALSASIKAGRVR